MSEREPGQLAFEAFHRAHGGTPDDTLLLWWHTQLIDENRAAWAAVEQAVKENAQHECEAVMSNAEHRKKIAEMEFHKSEISFQDGRWHAAYDILEAIRHSQEHQTT